MKYTRFKELELSRLGFGTMRLPMKDGEIDREAVQEMVDYAIGHGVNYFDTAYPYHGGKSEIVIGEALSRHPREKWMIADKFPGHQTASSYEPSVIFEDQLRKCKVDKFDFYLMHNICENDFDVYMDPKWHILEYFTEQKANGRIGHLGFSAHGELETLERFLDSPYGSHMEFCQIQLNVLDWSHQKAEQKVELLRSRGIPIWVMEPLRGGKLLQAVSAQDAFNWLMDIPGVTMILSGMSAPEQMRQNIAIFEEPKPLTVERTAELYAAVEKLKNSVPCTACRYCCDRCPMGLDIPTLLQARNDLAVETSFTPIMRMESLPADQHPTNCIACRACTKMCPQGIDIPQAIKELISMLEKAPTWAAICKEREETARKLRENE